MEEYDEEYVGYWTSPNWSAYAVALVHDTGTGFRFTEFISPAKTIPEANIIAALRGLTLRYMGTAFGGFEEMSKYEV